MKRNFTDGHKEKYFFFVPQKQSFTNILNGAESFNTILFLAKFIWTCFIFQKYLAISDGRHTPLWNINALHRKRN